MKYTAVFMDVTGKYLTRFFVTSHDKSQAWGDILSKTSPTHRLLLIIPGEQLVYSDADISFTSIA